MLGYRDTRHELSVSTLSKLANEQDRNKIRPYENSLNWSK